MIHFKISHITIERLNCNVLIKFKMRKIQIVVQIIE